MRRFVPIVAAGAAALMPGWALAQQAEPYRYGYGPHMDWVAGWNGMMLGPLFMVLILAAVIALVIVLVRWFGGSWHATGPTPYTPAGRAPLDILRERYARGEIDKGEFEERRHVLGD